MPCLGCGPGLGADKAPVAVSKTQAEAELKRMKRSLKGWLKYRRINDEIAAGTRKAKVPPGLAKKRLERDRDWQGEQKLAEDLYLLLSEIYDSRLLPLPDIAKDPSAAVKLAEIVISGKAPEGSVAAPVDQGFIPLLIMAGAGVMLLSISSWISNRAEVQKEKERIECIKSGACTDYGFWLKWGAVAAAGVLVYVNRKELLDLFKLGAKKVKK